jgi:hypothetical protein
MRSCNYKTRLDYYRTKIQKKLSYFKNFSKIYNWIEGLKEKVKEIPPENGIKKRKDF